jgi:hypothetical protein
LVLVALGCGEFIAATRNGWLALAASIGLGRAILAMGFLALHRSHTNGC